MMALCMVGHSGYAVESTPTQKNANNLDEWSRLYEERKQEWKRPQQEKWDTLYLDQKKQWEKAIQEMKEIKEKIDQGGATQDLGQLYDDLREATPYLDPALHGLPIGLPIYDEFERIRIDVQNRLDREREQQQKEKWDSLTRDQKKQVEERLEMAIQEMKEVKEKIKQGGLKVEDWDQLSARQASVSKFLQWDTNDGLPYHTVPEMKTKYDEFLNLWNDDRMQHEPLIDDLQHWANQQFERVRDEKDRLDRKWEQQQKLQQDSDSSSSSEYLSLPNEENDTFYSFPTEANNDD